jgi:hypothetical protein
MMRRILAALATSLSRPTAHGARRRPATSPPAWQSTPTSWTNPDGGLPLDHRPALRHAPDLRPGGHHRQRQAAELPDALRRTQFHYDGSGALVPIRGGMDLVLFPAFAHRTDGSSCYAGRKLVRPGFPALKAIAFTGDFEGYVSFAFELDGRNPYRIFRLHDPQRIVLDFRHAG